MRNEERKKGVGCELTATDIEGRANGYGDVPLFHVCAYYKDRLSSCEHGGGVSRTVGRESKAESMGWWSVIYPMVQKDFFVSSAARCYCHPPLLPATSLAVSIRSCSLCVRNVAIDAVEVTLAGSLLSGYQRVGATCSARCTHLRWHESVGHGPIGRSKNKDASDDTRDGDEGTTTIHARHESCRVWTTSQLTIPQL